MKAVRGRKCGQCTVCCRIPPIVSDAFVKPANSVCEHCVEGSGCAIYAERPKVCAEWYCGWRMFEDLDDAWRPDRSGVLIVEETDDIPWRFRNRIGVKFIIDGPDACVLNKKFILFLAGLISRDVACFLSVAGPPGHGFAKMFVNERLERAALTGDGHAMVEVLTDVLKTLRGGTFEAER
ncbi:MAG TPA: hypothetical protein VG407_05280 [Caulobacteraceae bacterium]|jgi:hypothetical protein|nr:hypothetical protein [Caulobacteraceae bacterium]